jgi:hypothetical protein
MAGTKVDDGLVLTGETKGFGGLGERVFGLFVIVLVGGGLFGEPEGVRVGSTSPGGGLSLGRRETGKGSARLRAKGTKVDRLPGPSTLAVRGKIEALSSFYILASQAGIGRRSSPRPTACSRPAPTLLRRRRSWS